LQTNGSFTADEIAKLIDSRTRVVTISSVAFHNGFAPDLDAIGALCRDRNVLLCVDAIQSVGVLPMNVRRSNIAFLACDGHKWMCASEGAALFYVAAEHRDKLEVLETGWVNVSRKSANFIDCGVDLLPDARRFEAGSLNTLGVHGVRAAIDLLLEAGIEAVSAEAVRLATKLADDLESIGWRVSSPRPIASAIIGAAPQAVDGRELLRLHGLLEKEGIVCAPREGMLRFSPHFYNSDEEIARVIDVLTSS
jgi:cysteine desulfurase/selenocysteine lyase